MIKISEINKKLIKNKSIDPLRRVFVPIEKLNIHGVITFQTTDRKLYMRDKNGCIRRIKPQV